MKLRAWLAIAAMALNALWPLIAQARPAMLVPVCTVGGETHYIEIPTGGSTSTHDHCAFCVAGAALPTPNALQGHDVCSLVSPRTVSSFVLVALLVEADARGPPVFPSFDSSNDNGRTNEEAFALRAARPDVGGGVVRFGILLG
jgi:hypothetical protein